MSLENTCAFTGHRPKSFPFGYDESHPDCKKIKKRIKKEIKAMMKKGVDIFISGAAMGVDMWAMEAVLELKKQNPTIRLVAAIPFRGQADRWSSDMQARYYGLLDQCDKVACFSENYSIGCYHERDRKMVDAAAHLIAVYNGSAEGGTAYTVAYAKENGRDVVLIDPSRQHRLFCGMFKQ